MANALASQNVANQIAAASNAGSLAADSAFAGYASAAPNNPAVSPVSPNAGRERVTLGPLEVLGVVDSNGLTPVAPYVPWDGTVTYQTRFPTYQSPHVPNSNDLFRAVANSFETTGAADALQFYSQVGENVSWLGVFGSSLVDIGAGAGSLIRVLTPSPRTRAIGASMIDVIGDWAGVVKDRVPNYRTMVPPQSPPAIIQVIESKTPAAAGPFPPRG